MSVRNFIIALAILWLALAIVNLHLNRLAEERAKAGPKVLLEEFPIR